MGQDFVNLTLDILKIIASIVALVASTAWVWEYRLKVRAERRLAESSEIESQIKLLRLFTEIMNIAHARGGYEVSEKAIEKILNPETLESFKPGSVELEDLLNTILIHIPVGDAAQDAAIAAIWKLGKEHKILRDVSTQALESITKFKSDIAKPYLEDLKSNA